MLTIVLLPAPFGPISAVICPLGTVKLQSSTALTPPKACVTCSTCRISACCDIGALLGDGRRWPATPEREIVEAPLLLWNDALRPEPEYDDEQRADDNIAH